MNKDRVSIAAIRKKKTLGEKICMLTAYDAVFAAVLEASGVDIVLVGDSLGNVALGYDSTVPVTMRDMIHHCRAVRRSIRTPLLVADLPFLSYQISGQQAIANAGRLIKDGGADAVKLEAGTPAMVDAAAAIIDAGIPVMGHVGLTPQTAALHGEYKVQGTDAAGAGEIISLAHRLAEVGCFAVVLECVPYPLAAELSRHLPIPTIGIGAGAGCDGQVLVTADLLGLSVRKPPRFVKQYASLYEAARNAVAAYLEEVRTQRFPDTAHSYAMAPDELRRITEQLLPENKDAA